MKSAIPFTQASVVTGAIFCKLDHGLRRSAAFAPEGRSGQSGGSPRAERLVPPEVGRGYIESGERLADGIIGVAAFLERIFKRLWRRSSAGARTSF
jgi:hypothetical protein